MKKAQSKRPRYCRNGCRDEDNCRCGARASSSAPAKKEHPELHVIAQVRRLRAHPPMTKLIGIPLLFAQLTPLAPSLPPITPCGEASSHSGKSEICRQSEDLRMGASYLIELSLRCAGLPRFCPCAGSSREHADS